MAFWKALMRIYAYLFHLLLALFLLAMASVALISHQELHLEMLPWTGRSLTYWLFFSTLCGLITVVLAIKGMLRPLFFLWSLAVVILLLRGFFFSSYSFHPGDFRDAAYLTGGALLALLGAWYQMGRVRARK